MACLIIVVTREGYGGPGEPSQLGAPDASNIARFGCSRFFSWISGVFQGVVWMLFHCKKKGTALIMLEQWKTLQMKIFFANLAHVVGLCVRLAMSTPKACAPLS
jgi:hypothetical protein